MFRKSKKSPLPAIGADVLPVGCSVMQVCSTGRCPVSSPSTRSYSGVCRDTDKKSGKVMDKLMCDVEAGNVGSNQCPAGQQFLCDGKSPVQCVPTPSGPTPSGPSGPTPSGPRPPGTLGGACMPNVTISGRPLPRCAPPAKCDTNDGSSTFGKCILPPPSGPATKSGMGSKEILTIIGLIFLGLCFLCGLAKMGMKDAKRKSNCDKACGAFVFLGVALIAVSSVLKSSGSTATGLIPAGEEGGPCKQLSDDESMCGSGLFCNNQNRCQKMPFVPGISPAPGKKSSPGKK